LAHVLQRAGHAASLFREVMLLSTATRALVNAMKAEHVSRLVSIDLFYRQRL